VLHFHIYLHVLLLEWPNNAFEIISLCFYSLAITHKFEKDASSSDGLAHDLAH